MIPLLLSLIAGGPALAAPHTQANAEPVEVDLEGPPVGFGMGVVIGEPTGLTFAVRPDGNNAVQAHASWSVIADRLRVSVDYLRTVARANGDGFNVPLYIGFGGVAGVQDLGERDEAAAIGARLPIGVAVHPSNVPVEPFLEVAPGVLVLPETEPIFEGTIGVRYYF